MLCVAGSVIQGEVTHVDEQGVHIAGRPNPIQAGVCVLAPTALMTSPQRTLLKNSPLSMCSADYTVIAVGATNPIHPPTKDLNETLRYYSGVCSSLFFVLISRVCRFSTVYSCGPSSFLQLQRRIATTERIAIIGAGSVGTELAGIFAFAPLSILLILALTCSCFFLPIR